MKLKAVFLDRDGELIPEIPNNVGVSNSDLNESIVEGLQLLQSYGYLLVLISDQPMDRLKGVKDNLHSLYSKIGIYLDGLYYCPHHPGSSVSEYTTGCDCHKPQPGMLLRAAEDMNIDLSSSWMIGDMLHDVEAGKRAGCKTILINNGKETEWTPGENRMPEFFAPDLAEAAKYILAASNFYTNHRKTHKRKGYSSATLNQ
jgi:D-glycero-D-manno-heptose 1,7-bisphosphate phosphatase